MKTMTRKVAIIHILAAKKVRILKNINALDSIFKEGICGLNDMENNRLEEEYMSEVAPDYPVNIVNQL